MSLERVKQEKNEVEINLADVFQILLSKWVYILIAGLVVALGTAAVTTFFIKKKYTATTTLYISASAEQSQSGSVSYSELNAADNLIKTYQEILKNNRILRLVADHFNEDHPEYANRNITVGTISKAVSVSVPSGTKLIRVAVKTGSPQLSADIANTFALYVPDEMKEITNGGNVSIVDYATVPTSHSSPNLTLNTLIGFAAGVLLTAVYFLLRAYLDTTIYTSEEVAKISRCPVIGTVPMIVVGTEEITPWEVSLREEISNE
jgi:capsular polysaccharide biosynthesis protein